MTTAFTPVSCERIDDVAFHCRISLPEIDHFISSDFCNHANSQKMGPEGAKRVADERDLITRNYAHLTQTFGNLPLLVRSGIFALYHLTKCKPDLSTRRGDSGEDYQCDQHN